MDPRRTTTIAAGLAAALTADALWRRSRAQRLAKLPPSDRPVAADHHFVTAAGVELDDATRRAASAYASAHDLQVLDLVPAGLDSLRAMELIRRVDPGSYRAARLALGEGGGHAVLADSDVLDRAGITQLDGLTPAEMHLLVARLKRYAPVRTDLAVTDGIDPVACSMRDRRAVLRQRWIGDLPTYLTGSLLGLGALGAGLAVTARRGRRGALSAAAVLAAASAQPYLATAGTPLRPRDRRGFALTRTVAAPLRWARVAAEREEPDPDLPTLRKQYAAELALGVERFYEPRRDDCPWCGSPAIRRLLTSGDHQHHRPGTFHLDECRGCGHVFQNPRLNLAGLDFHYRDFYDGNGGPEVERGFRLAAPHYRDRARMLRGHAVPKAWLDVGGGHGHFCNAARDVWPDTRFDALDMSVSVKEAERQGWIDGGHLGLFPELADELAGAYDVVSMHHYLEHTIDPRAELDAAVKVLPPGGHLLIEVPDPEWFFGRVAGKWWHAWFQPQHLHFVPLANLVTALHERGLRTVAVHRGEAHQPVDMLMFFQMLAHRVVPDPNKPWRDPRYKRLRMAARTATYLAGTPIGLAGAMADQLSYPLIKRTRRSNTYRILAQKPAGTGL